jgi:hypothetical protein
VAGRAGRGGRRSAGHDCSAPAVMVARALPARLTVVGPALVPVFAAAASRLLPDWRPPLQRWLLAGP